MIEFVHGDLFEAEVEALVNAVNCVGVMGKGLALQFKHKFPENFAAYKTACKESRVLPGQMFVYEPDQAELPKYIINFPTKRHWRTKSLMEDIQLGLAALRDDVERLRISSIAIPPLGCGLGGLEWDRVREKIEFAFGPMSKVRALVFEPINST